MELIMNSHLEHIAETVKKIYSEIPDDVILLAAAKTRSLEEVEAIISAGVRHIGYNYLQEALPIIEKIGGNATWHMIGHIQSNKAKLVVDCFDMVQTIDSWKIANRLNGFCKKENKIMPVLIEINSGRESNKTGLMPELLEELILKMSALQNLRIQGLMTMGPRFGNPEDSRPYFVSTRTAFEKIASKGFLHVEMKYLSMGMSNSYKIAIEEGANIVRIGTKLFGERE